MSSGNLPIFVLQELPDISYVIKEPLENAQRIKYTCFDVSERYIVFGATSGGIYIFNRQPCEFVQLIPNQVGAITKLAISANEKYIAFACGKGVVTVTECTQTVSGSSNLLSKEHQGNEVTSMVWTSSSLALFIGDDVGKVSILQMPSFITKTMFISSQIIMQMDSRICQLNIKHCMLLVSTLTRCFICDTSKEQYRQIGQKLRDGEFGACFYTTKKSPDNASLVDDDVKEVKKYNILDGSETFAVNTKLANTFIYSARPSSRLWEASIDGTVLRTHQFKEVLSRKPFKLISALSHEKENLCIQTFSNDGEPQSLNFTKIFNIDNVAIFTYKKDGLYFLNVSDVEQTMWFDIPDILDCCLFKDFIYVWFKNGSIYILKFLKIEKYLVKCYFDEKYLLCAKLCALYKDYFLNSNYSPNNLHILVNLKEKLGNDTSDIDEVLNKFDDLKIEATQLKSGIYVVDNTYSTESFVNGLENETDDNRFLTPEALQALKGLSLTVSDKFSNSKKILKEKWDDLEEKVRSLGGDKNHICDITEPTTSKEDNKDNDVHFKQTTSKEDNKDNDIYIEQTTAKKDIVKDNDIRIEQTAAKEEINEAKDINIEQTTAKEDNDNLIERTAKDTVANVNNDDIDIIYKDSSQKNKLDNKIEKICKSLYQYYRLSLVEASAKSNLSSIIDDFCDISEIHQLMIEMEKYCISIGDIDESKFAASYIFLTYTSSNKYILNDIVKNELLYKYFVDSCIAVNTRSKITIGCKCGFPLPYKTNERPVFSQLIDEFLEKQWLSQTPNQCYDICKRMPYLWKKILYLRRNEDLMNLLQILLQILDESLLHSFLPQFTLDTWDKAIQLYATLHANICLNCGSKFDNVNVKDKLDWDRLGGLIIKSIGGRNALKVMEKNADLIEAGELTMRFYHTALTETLFEKYDATLVNQLVDAIYTAYDYEQARSEIKNLLRNSLNGEIKNTSLPLTVAEKSSHWGLNLHSTKETSVNSSVDFSYLNVDCSLCGLPLKNEVLVKEGGLWVFKCGDIFHGSCLDLNKIKLCPKCLGHA